MHKNKRLKKLTNKLSPVQILLTFYFLSVLVSTILLALPIVHKPNVELSFMDLLFNAVSALSVTGLSTIVISETLDRKSTRLNSSHVAISYAVFCLKIKRDE